MKTSTVAAVPRIRLDDATIAADRPSPLRHAFGLSAEWLAGRIQQSPILLGLTTGMPALERIMQRPGPDQFAVLLFDPSEGVRHVVEVQLGPADEDQLGRAIGLWTAERFRLGVTHRVAIAAEHIDTDVALAAAFARDIVPIDLIRLHAEQTGNIVTVYGRPVEAHDPAS